jgi:hypothetical protein
MASVFWTLLNDKPDRTRAKVIAIYGILLIFNLDCGTAFTGSA